jgi:hypothetical protein
LGAFLVKYCGASDGPGATFSSFEFSDDEIIAVEESVKTIQANGKVYACGDTGGLVATGPDGAMALSLGFNLDWVQRALRDVLTPNRSSGIAFVNRSSILDPEVNELGVVTCLFFLRQELRQKAGRWSEGSVELRLFIVSSEKQPAEVVGLARARIVRALCSCSRVKDPQEVRTRSDLPEIESNLVNRLRTPSEEDIAQGIRYSVSPLAAVTIAP